MKTEKEVPKFIKEFCDPTSHLDGDSNNHNAFTEFAYSIYENACFSPFNIHTSDWNETRKEIWLAAYLDGYDDALKGYGIKKRNKNVQKS